MGYRYISLVWMGSGPSGSHGHLFEGSAARVNSAFRELCQRASSARNLSARKPCEVRGLSVKSHSAWPEQVVVDEWLKYRTFTRDGEGEMISSRIIFRIQ